jgi:transposase
MATKTNGNGVVHSDSERVARILAELVDAIREEAVTTAVATEYLPVGDAAEMFGKTPAQIRKWVDRKYVDAKPLGDERGHGRPMLVNVAQVEARVRENRGPGRPRSRA